MGDHGTRSNQRSIRRVPIMPPDRIRTLPFGTGLVLLRSARPIVTDLHPWPNRSDEGQLLADREGDRSTAAPHRELTPEASRTFPPQRPARRARVSRRTVRWPSTLSNPSPGSSPPSRN
jgi:hypothetical protein